MHQTLCIVIFLFVQLMVCSSNEPTQKDVMHSQDFGLNSLEKANKTKLGENEVLNRISRQARISFTQALQVIEKQHLKKCLAFLICSLTCDSKVFGEEGEHVYQSFKNLTNIKPKEETMDNYRYYKDAEAQGLVNKINCNLCEAKYPTCQKRVKLLFKMIQNVKIIDTQ